MGRLSGVLCAVDDEALERAALRMGLVTEAQLQDCERDQAATGNPFVAIELLRRGLVSPAHLSALLSEIGPDGQVGEPLKEGLFLGFLLAAEGAISPRDLEGALLEQWKAQRAGQPRRIAELLVTQGRVSLDVLRRHLYCPRCGAKNEDASWTPERDPRCLSCRAAPSSEAGDASPRIGCYRLLAPLRQGSGGQVWKAWDPRLGRVVALKSVPTADAATAEGRRLMRIIQTLARLSHPNLPPIHDVGLHSGHLYFAMGFIEGRPLEQVIREGLPWRTAVELARTMAETLHHLHLAGIVHRDVNPRHILIDGSGRPYLIDFGASKDLERSEATEGSRVAGSFPYMSPEQVQGGDVGPAADQFSLGVVLYEMLAGTPPFLGKSLPDTFDKICEADPPSLFGRVPGVSRDLEAVLWKALSKDPRSRYASLEGFAQDLQRILQNEAVEARPVSRTRRWFRKRRADLRLALAVGLLAVAGTATWLIGRGQGEAGLRTPLPRSEDSARRDDRDEERRRGEQNRSRARALIEKARSPLEEAARYVYSADVAYEPLLRRVEVAQEWFRSALQLDPENVLGHYLEGWAWELLGWEDRARDSYRRALELDPEFALPHHRLGQMALTESLRHMARIPGTLSRWSRGEADRLREEAEHHLAAAFRSPVWDDPLERDVLQAMLAAARLDWSRALALAAEGAQRHGDVPGVERFHWLTGVGLRAEEPLNRALGIRPRYPLALFWRAVLRRDRRALKEAEADLSLALEVNPRFVEAYHNRGEVRFQIGRFDEGLADYDRAIEVAPGLAELFNNRAVGHALMGNAARAWEDVSRALELAPEFPDAWVNRGILKIRRGDAQGGREDFDQALRIDPDHVEALFNRGLLRYRSGDWEGAMADWSRGLQRAPDRPDLRYNRGSLRLKMRDGAGAVEDFEHLLRHVPPNWPNRPEAEERLRIARSLREPKEY